ncbi:hypothetical protein M0812_27721 [Anaeramoeba flamelloides]|uniref:Uncharacterized protein n=1 Tax=Anaeramoeba flamelloides TaxID=1746091 RepID=A0AAV7Y8H2_9EUKA|nr:hypothetical protein M0812_27721 [Anaeramoeba flamelloides]
MGSLSHKIRYWYLDLSLESKLFFLFVFLQAIGLIIVQTLGLVNYSDKENVSKATLIFYSIIFYLVIGFTLIFAFVIIWSNNVHRLVTFVIAISLLTLYAIYEIAKMPNNPRIQAEIAIVLCFDVIYGILLYRLKLNFDFKNLEKASADIGRQALYRIWSIFVSILHVDAMVNIVLLIAAAFFLLEVDDYEFWLDLFFVLLNTFWDWVGYVSNKDEIHMNAKIFLGTGFVQPFYLIAKLCMIWMQKKYKTIPRVPVTIMIVAGLMIRVLLIYFAFKSYKDFDKGRKYILHNKSDEGKHALNKDDDDDEEVDDGTSSENSSQKDESEDVESSKSSQSSDDNKSEKSQNDSSSGGFSTDPENQI